MPIFPSPLARPAKALAIALATCGLLALAPATTSAAGKGKKAPAATHAPAQKRSVKVKPSQNHSAETTAEREHRLLRECKGMPNAGACLGYTGR